MKRYQRVFAWICMITLMAGTFLTAFGWADPARAAAGMNLAAGKDTSASGHADVYVSANIVDENDDTYWESTNQAFPQWVQVDLAQSALVEQVALKLPAGWESRSQTLSVQGSADGSTFTQLKASNTYTFDPNTDNTVAIDLAAAEARYVRIEVTANTGWPAAQLAELEVYGTTSPGTPDHEPPTAPASLTYTQSAADTIQLTWAAATDNVGVTGYDVYANHQLRGSVDGSTLAYTDQQPADATVTYYVTAKDEAGNVSAPSNSVTRTASGGGQDEVNLALGKPITASSSAFNFVAANANDNDTSTYWEGNGHPSTLTVDLGADASISAIRIKLNPASDWATRTQTMQVLGHTQEAANFTSLVSASSYTFNPALNNTVTIPVSATVSSVQLRFTDNSGAPGGQVAELEVIGTPAPNPDLTVTNIAWSPSSPDESQSIALQATVANLGDKASGATDINFYLGSQLAGTAPVSAIEAGQSVEVSATIEAMEAGSYNLTAKVNESNTVIEKDNTNNSYTHAAPLVVGQVQSSDLVAAAAWTPSSPSAGDTVTFSVNLHNQGILAAASGAHGITLVLKDAGGSTIQSFTQAYNGSLAAGASATVTMGTWTAVNGSYTVTATVEADANEVASKQANNTQTVSLYSGRGANMPFTILEAEAPGNNTNGTRLAPNFTPGDFAGEASGRSAVRLDAPGEYVEFTLTSPANAFVLRNAVDEDTTGTISIYADGVDKGDFTVTSKFSYVYATPSTLGQLGYDNSGSKAYWLYEDAQLMLDQVYPAGTKIKIQKDAGDVPWIYVDMIETEHVAPAASNPDPSKYVEVSSTKSIEQALNEFRQDPAKQGIFIPAGEWTISSKIYLYGRATEIIGAGPWHTKLMAPQDKTNTDVGFNIGSQANGSTIKDLSAWDNYVYRVDGPGKFIDGNGMQNVTIENIWAEHFICLYWGVNSSYNTFKDNRIKNVFADGINMTNGSSYNIIDNNYARGTGDDSFALFSAIDSGGSYNVRNKYTNLTATNVRRAAAFAIYGGKDNLFQNLYGADTLTYPGLTVSSLSFGYNTLGFGDEDTVIDGVTLDRTGGDFWTSVGADDKINEYQNYGAIWLYSGDRDFKNVVVKNVDINDPVYFGIMLQTKSPENLPMENVRLENININNPTRYGIKLVVRAEAGQGPAVGEASFTNVQINNPGVTAIYGESGSPDFNVIRVSGNNW